MSLGDIQVDLRLMTAKFSQGINTANNNLNDLKRSTDLAKKAVGGLVAALAVREVAQFVGRTIEAGAALDQVSDRLGVTTDWLTEMTYAASQYGVQNDALIDGIKELSLRTDEFVATGAGPAEEAFSRLGLSQSELNAVSHDTAGLFDLVADRLRNVENVAARQRLVDEIFGGTGGEQMAAMASATATEIRGLRDEAQRLGITLSEIDTKRLLEAQKSINRAKASFDGMSRSMVADLAPTIVSVTDTIVDEFADVRDIVSDPAFEQSAAALASALTTGFKESLRVIKNTGRELRALGLIDPAEETSDRINQINEDLQALRAEAERNIFQRDMFSTPGLGPGLHTTEEIKEQIRLLEAEKQLILENAGIQADRDNAAGGSAPDKPSGGGSGGLGGGTQAEADAIQKKVEALRLEAETLRMTTTEAELYKLKVEGATPAQLRNAEASLRARDAYEKEKEALEANVESRQIANEIIAEIEADRKSQIEDGEQLLERYMTEEELLQEHHERRLDVLEAARAADFDNKEKWDRAIEAENQRHEDAVSDVSKKEQFARNQLASNMLSQMSSLMSSKYKEFFLIGKAAALANVAVMAPEKAEAAAAWGMKLGGPPLAAAFTAASYIVSAAHAAQIASANFGGGGGVSGSGGYGGGVNSVPAAPAPVQLNPGAESGGSSGSLTIVFQGDVTGFDQDELADTLMNKMGDEINNLDRVVIDPKSRNGRLLRGR